MNVNESEVLLEGENVEVQRRWRVEFGIPPPLTRVAITKIRDKLEVHGTVEDMLNGRCGIKRKIHL